jgi:hypothetical protein
MSCGGWLPRCCHRHPDLHMAADDAPSRIGTAWPRSSTWPVPPRRGGCCRPVSLAAARRRRSGAGWTSGPRQACSTPSTAKCWTGWGWRAGWTGRGRAWTRSACGPSGGDLVGANPVDRGKPGSKLHLVTDGHGLPLAVAVTAANVNDGSMFEALLDDVPRRASSLGATALPSWQGSRRQGIRRPALPSLSATAWDQGAHRATWDRVV